MLLIHKEFGLQSRKHVYDKDIKEWVMSNTMIC